jgi:hypothetical protein
MWMKTEVFWNDTPCRLVMLNGAVTSQKNWIFIVRRHAIWDLQKWNTESALLRRIIKVHDFSFPPSTAWVLKTGPIRCPETSANNYQSTLRNIPEELRFHGKYLRIVLFMRTEEYCVGCLMNTAEQFLIAFNNVPPVLFSYKCYFAK